MSRTVSRYTVARPSIADRVSTRTISTMTNAVFRFCNGKYDVGFKRDTLIGNIIDRRGFDVSVESVTRALRALRARGDIRYTYDRATKRYICW